MSGLDCLGCDTTIGFDYMSLLKGAGGLLSGGEGGSQTAAQAAEAQRLKDEKARAEQSAATMKMVLGGVVVLGGVGLIVALGRR